MGLETLETQYFLDCGQTGRVGSSALWERSVLSFSHVSSVPKLSLLIMAQSLAPLTATTGCMVGGSRKTMVIRFKELSFFVRSWLAEA